MSTANLKLEEIISDDTIRGSMLEKINANMAILDAKYGALKNALLEQTGKSNLEEAIAYVDELAVGNKIPIPNNKVENLLIDGKYKDISSNYTTNSVAKFTSYNGYTRYTMTSAGSSGYVYNIESKDAGINLEANHRYAYFIKWRNISGFESTRAAVWLKGTTTSGSTSVSRIYNSNFVSHQDTESFKLNYVIIKPTTNYYSIRFCINTPDIGTAGAGFDVEWIALLDLTECFGDDNTYDNLICENIEKILIFPEV